MKIKIKLNSEKTRKPKNRKTKYSPEIVEKLRELFFVGNHTIREASKIVGLKAETLLKWVNIYPDVRKLMEKVRTRPTTATKTLAQYAYDRLDPELQHYWDRLKEFDEEPNAVRKIEMLLGNSPRIRQHLYIHALIKFNFRNSMACRFLNISPDCVERWVREEEEFARLIENLKIAKKDFFEGALLNLVAGGDPNAILFCARTQLKDRGYTEKTEIQHTHAGKVDHKHTHTIDRATIDAMPLEKRKQMLALLDEIDSNDDGTVIDATSPPTVVES